MSKAPETDSPSAIFVEMLEWHSVELVVTLVTIGIGFSACCHAGYWSNIIDIAPQHTGVIASLS